MLPASGLYPTISCTIVERLPHGVLLLPQAATEVEVQATENGRGSEGHAEVSYNAMQSALYWPSASTSQPGPEERCMTRDLNTPAWCAQACKLICCVAYWHAGVCLKAMDMCVNRPKGPIMTQLTSVRESDPVSPSTSAASLSEGVDFVELLTFLTFLQSSAATCTPGCQLQHTPYLRVSRL